jgi:hypothetical protein
MMQDQSQGENAVILSCRALQRVITLRPVLLYYAMMLANEFNVTNRLRAATFIVWRIAS